MVLSGTSATRMELLRLRKRLLLARRGHHLLKGKQDELLRRFMALLESYLPARRDLNAAFAELEIRIAHARAEVGEDEVRAAAWPPRPRVTVQDRKRRILNLEIPAREARLERHRPAYSPSQLPAPFDDLVEAWEKAVPSLVATADREETLLLLAEEIKRTRRRVSALEYKLIPGLEEGIRLISFKLAEAELGNLSRLMRIKEIVRPD